MEENRGGYGLAEQWASRAEQLPDKWGRAKRLCQRIADSWRQMAKDFDVDAAKRRLNF
jgi:hypothetical protein